MECEYKMVSDHNGYVYCTHPGAIKQAGTEPYCIMTDDYMRMFGPICPIKDHDFKRVDSDPLQRTLNI